MPARRNPLCHPLSAAKACRAARNTEPSTRARPGDGSISGTAFQQAVDRGFRRFWLRRGIDVDSGRVNDI